jgi:hypothetical protein
MTPAATPPTGPDDPPRIDRSGYELELDERFAGPALDEAVWIPAYLPHWSTPERSAARFDVGLLAGGRGLRLRIDADQPAWSPEWNGRLRVSNLQTGAFSGPAGSGVGQHHFRPDLIVRTALPERRLRLPRYGIVELQARASADPAVLCALWLIGFEDEPQRSAEICIMEVFGRDIRDGTTRVGLGVHPFGDPQVRDDFAAVSLPIDATETHTYSAEWLPGRVRFYVDDTLVRVVDQAPDYPLQLMLDIYELPDETGSLPPSPGDAYPKVFEVDWVRGWRRG